MSEDLRARQVFCAKVAGDERGSTCTREIASDYRGTVGIRGSRDGEPRRLNIQDVGRRGWAARVRETDSRRLTGQRNTLLGTVCEGSESNPTPPRPEWICSITLVNVNTSPDLIRPPWSSGSSGSFSLDPFRLGISFRLVRERSWFRFTPIYCEDSARDRKKERVRERFPVRKGAEEVERLEKIGEVWNTELRRDVAERSCFRIKLSVPEWCRDENGEYARVTVPCNDSAIFEASNYSG